MNVIAQNNQKFHLDVLSIGTKSGYKSLSKKRLALEGVSLIQTIAPAKINIHKFLSTKCDAILIFTDHSKTDGCDLCGVLRRSGSMKPILLLKSNATVDDEIESLDSGASDFVALPCNYSVLAARIRAHVRHSKRNGNASYRLGPINFDPYRKIISNDLTQENTALTSKETALLKYLCTAEGRLISKEELMENVWGYNKEARSNTLKTHLHRLRQKLGCGEYSGKIIKSEHRGLRLIAFTQPWHTNLDSENLS